MSTAVDIRPHSPERVQAPELDHYVCCRNYAVALCKTPDAGALVMDDEHTGNEMCVVCLDLDQVKHCPCGMTCPS